MTHSIKVRPLSKTRRWLRKPWYRFWQFVENRFYAGQSYSLKIPYGYRVFTPWFDTTNKTDFAHALKTIRSSGPLEAKAESCYILYQFARRSTQLPGDMAECGVGYGGTAHLISWAISSFAPSPSPDFHLFDSFSGSSPHGTSDMLAYVEKRLQKFATFCQFHSGLIPESFTKVADITQYSFVHVDVNQYSPVMECCEWFWPRLGPSGTMVFDNYGFYRYPESRKAIDAFFANQAEFPIVLPTGQAIVFKDTRASLA